MTDVYRSLVANLRDKLGGTINDANADAIARAAAQVYRREVEPRLWEEKSAHQLLDSFGVPRSGSFIPYSLSDRLLLLHRSHSEDPSRVHAHDLLDQLEVPRIDGAGREHSLKTRLTLLLGSLDYPSESAAQSGTTETNEATSPPDLGPDATAFPGRGALEDGPDATKEPTVDPAGVDRGVGPPELVTALETIQRAVGPAAAEEAVPTPPPLSSGPSGAPDLIGLGTVLGSIQEKLVEIEQAVESLRQELRDAVTVFQAGGGKGLVAPVPGDVGSPEAVSETVIRRDQGPSEGTPPPVGSHSGAPEPGLSDSRPLDVRSPDAGPVDPHEPTRVLAPAETAPPDLPQSADDAVVIEEVGSTHRARRAVLLVVLVLLIATLLAASITAAAVLGWDQLKSRIGGFVDVPRWDDPWTAWW